MADPIAVQLANAAFTILGALSGIAEVELMPAGDPSRFPAVRLFDRGEDVVRQDVSLTYARMTLAVEGYVQGTGADAWEEARALDAAIIGAFGADPQFGGLAIDIDIGPMDLEIVAIASRGRTVAFRRSFAVQFSYRTTDPTLNF